MTSSFRTNIGALSYGFRVKTNFEYQCRVFAAKWKGAGVEVLPHCIRREDGGGMKVQKHYRVYISSSEVVGENTTQERYGAIQEEPSLPAYVENDGVVK